MSGTKEQQSDVEVSDFAVIDAMVNYGGHFVSALGSAARYADSQNLAKIKVTFSEYWSRYRDMAIKLRDTAVDREKS